MSQDDVIEYLRGLPAKQFVGDLLRCGRGTAPVAGRVRNSTRSVMSWLTRVGTETSPRQRGRSWPFVQLPDESWGDNAPVCQHGEHCGLHTISWAKNSVCPVCGRPRLWHVTATRPPYNPPLQADPRRQRPQFRRGVGASVASIHRRALSLGRLSGPLFYRAVLGCYPAPLCRSSSASLTGSALRASTSRSSTTVGDAVMVLAVVPGERWEVEPLRRRPHRGRGVQEQRRRRQRPQQDLTSCSSASVRGRGTANPPLQADRRASGHLSLRSGRSAYPPLCIHLLRLQLYGG